MNTLAGKNVLVVGGTQGIGAAVVQAALAAGATVFAAGRSGSAVPGVKTVAVDLASPAQFASQLATLPQLDHVVFTAGARIGSPRFAEADLAEWRLGFEVKFFGTIALLQALLPKLADDASIVLTSGMLSRKATVGGITKATLNAATEALGRNLAKELAPRRVNVVSPGVTSTDIWGSGSARDDKLAGIAGNLPAGKVVQPADLAQLYLLALTQPAMTGSILDLEAGALL
ncbi:3-oxoacyl-[acyl-carrier-protein] reductase FabG [Andreprevotia sp. IGB-42]|uniref:SDR family oxidoreductase n=1 Tax=Andreprevotia sp. IGB-42 TaxID=2497473 RepID=UPI00135CC216|nr:SDR family oxidoreductase [Andreprevotia sp. IGB-42]KAF0813770.1 3-oxoacyl-[acyl-carrier-protein] reductase FabG [Andreprevotia sp. IGB-42]